MDESAFTRQVFKELDNPPLERVINFATHVAGQTSRPFAPNPIPATTALNEAVVERLMDDEYRDLCMFALDQYAEDEPDVIANKMFKTLIYLAVPEDGTPLRDALHRLTTLESAQDWHKVIDQVVNDDITQSRFLAHLAIPIASNVSERGELLEATALLHGKPEPRKVVEFGSSLELIAKRLIGRQVDPSLAFDPTAVHSRQPLKRENPRDTVDPEMTHAYNRMMQMSPFVMRHAMGVDAFNYRRDERMRRWAAINSWYLEELLDDKKMDRFFTLVDTEPAGLEFVEADAANVTAREIGGLAELTFLPTVIYQLRKDDLRGMLRSAEACTAGDGLVIVQDKVRFAKNNQISFYKRWEWNYGLWVKDMANPDLGFQKYFTSDGGRVNAIVIEDAAKQAPNAELLFSK